MAREKICDKIVLCEGAIRKISVTKILVSGWITLYAFTLSSKKFAKYSICTHYNRISYAVTFSMNSNVGWIKQRVFQGEVFT